MVFISGKGPEKRAKRHIWFLEERGLNKGQSVTYGFPKWKEACAGIFI
jgi:hypothetical protein